MREVLTEAGPEWHAADHPESRAWFESHADRERAGGLEPGDGSIWCEAMPKVVHELASPLQAGLFLAVDYGDHASHLLAKGADLRRFKAHAVDGRWWEALGASDLTADVDFTRLQSLLEAEGLRDVAHQELSRWIRAHAPLAQWEADWQTLDPKARMKRMENLLQLTMPGMMGARFRVLEGWKG